MASRFVELNEAAKILGVTPEQLVEMRSNGEIHGYRDGGSWKFKSEEIDRVKGELAGGGASDSGPIPFDDLGDLTAADEGAEDSGPVLVKGADGGAKAPTVIGDAETPATDSDLRLTSGSELTIKPDVGGTDLTLVPADSSNELADEDEISLDAGPSIGGSSIDSDVALVAGIGNDTDVKLVPDTGSDKGLKSSPNLAAEVLGDSDMTMKGPSASGTGPLSGRSGVKGPGSTGLGSGDLDIALDSELALSDDDEMVLGGSGVGSDLSLDAAESGINLGSPTDSGLSLEADSGISLQTPTDSGLSLEEEPLEMSGSSVSALELPEDETIELDTDAEPGAALKKDEDFLLTPSDEMFADESDSGSQVIALEDSAAFDQDAANMLQGQPALIAEAGGLDQQLDALGGGGMAATPVVLPTRYGPVSQPEAPHSAWTIIGLLSILFFLSFTGVFMSDIVRNMWAWEDGLDVSSSIAAGITDALFR
jgi:excisionase family DNA binding protein